MSLLTRTAMRHRGFREDRGSLPIALIAVIAVAGLSAGLVATTVGGTRAVRFDQDYTEVITAADRGLQEAEYRIARTVDPSYGSSEVVGNAAPTGTVLTGPAAGGDYTWQATKVGALSWELTSSGTVDGVTRTVEAEVSDRSRFWVAAFSDTGVEMRGGNNANSYDGNGWYTGNGIIASNEDVRLAGNATVNGVELYNWDNYQGNQRCSGGGACNDVLATPTAIAPSARIGSPLEVGGDLLPTAFIDEAIAACGIPLESYYASVQGSVLGPPYTDAVFCVQDLIIDADTTVASAVTIYVAGEVRVSNHTSVNCTGCVAGSSTPDASLLRIYSAGGDVELGNHVEIAAAIYAPESECGGNGSNAQTQIYGSLICGSISNQGGWGFHYDDRLGAIGTGRFNRTAWREEAPAS